MLLLQDDIESSLPKPCGVLPDILRSYYKPYGGDGDEVEAHPEAHPESTLRSRTYTPEQLYEREVKSGEDGLKFESRLGSAYVGPNLSQYHVLKEKTQLQMKQVLKDVPHEWKLWDVYDPNCERGQLGEFSQPCRKDACPQCSRAKIKHRAWLRKLARKKTAWHDLSAHMRRKYISYWMEANPISRTNRDVLDPKGSRLAELARIIFSNVPMPPNADACVVIDLLQDELNIEDIMDDVTRAMSISTLHSEVGEKTAFRLRLLEGNISQKSDSRDLIERILGD